jgi:hypothetical protein
MTNLAPWPAFQKDLGHMSITPSKKYRFLNVTLFSLFKSLQRFYDKSWTVCAVKLNPYIFFFLLNANKRTLTRFLTTTIHNKNIKRNKDAEQIKT